MLIGENWKIETTRLNVTLYQKKKGKNNDYWKEAGYYSSLAEALAALVDFGVMDSELKDLKTIIAKIDEIKAIISEAVKSGSKD